MVCFCRKHLLLVKIAKEDTLMMSLRPGRMGFSSYLDRMQACSNRYFAFVQP